MKKIKLFDYQEDMKSRIEKALGLHRSVMVQMPTGTGKTILLASVVESFLREHSNCNVWIVAHRRELVSQIKDTLNKFLLNFIFSNHPVPPTNDINKTIEFYHALGFETALRTVNGTEEVAFLQLHNLIIETYQNHQAKMEYGAIDHIAIDVKNIDDLFLVVKEAGTFKMLDQQVNGLPFWENGVKFFTIEGPNKEKIEFCEKL